MLIASGLLALLIGVAFAVLLSSMAELRASERRARQSEEVLVVANRLEWLVVDLETAQRGFFITGRERILQPWQSARAAFPSESRTLERLVAGNPEQEARAHRIAQAATSYLQDYSVPLVTAARRDPNAGRTVQATDEGRERIDAIRLEFDRFLAAEEGLAADREGRSDAAAERAVAAAAIGLGGSLLLIAVYTRLSAVLAAGRTGHRRASGLQYPGVSIGRQWRQFAARVRYRGRARVHSHDL